MVGSQDGHDMLRVVKLVRHAICATSCGPHPGEFALQRMANATRVLAQRSDHELHDGSSDSFG